MRGSKDRQISGGRTKGGKSKSAITALRRRIAYTFSKMFKNTAASKSIKITVIYFIFGSIWILATDYIAKLLFRDPSGILNASITKGLFYILVTAIIIYLLIYPILRKAMIAQKKLVRANKELSETIDDLRESERSKSIFISHIPGIAYRRNYDKNLAMQFISDQCFALTGYKARELTGSGTISYGEIICKEYRGMLREEWARAIEAKSTFKCEYEISTISGERKWVLDMGQPIFGGSGNTEALEGVVIDISEVKRNYERIKYISDHDSLTGLFNRTYFENKKLEADAEARLPLSIILADINGVRLINDAFGHAAGDELIKRTGEILKKCCAGRDAVVARTGGDEFSILLPETGREECSGILLLIANECGMFNSSVSNKENIVNLSLGAGVKLEAAQSMDEVENEAENGMYKSKLLDSESHHNAIISSIMATMYARSQETEEHAQRLAKYTKMIGLQMSLPQKSIDDLELLSMLHDIGKIGIDDRILDKPGKLTDDEWAVMKKHPQIGYSIAMSSPELKTVAEYILRHHERWDGTGYPGGLAGENIPLPSRILAVADAYDAMTEDRVYRKALGKREAAEEIKRNSGKQFDPNIAELFIKIISPESSDTAGQ